MPEMFSARASLYEFATRRISLFSDFKAAVADEILKKVTSGTVLDVGTGPAHLPIKIADRNLSLEIVGLDVSRDMIKIARVNAHIRLLIFLVIFYCATTVVYSLRRYNALSKSE
jgi:ubiquinone/menaquinone biosynthesis C-methylase UbiE